MWWCLFFFGWRTRPPVQLSLPYSSLNYFTTSREFIYSSDFATESNRECILKFHKLYLVQVVLYFLCYLNMALLRQIFGGQGVVSPGLGLQILCYFSLIFYILFLLVFLFLPFWLFFITGNGRWFFGSCHLCILECKVISHFLVPGCVLILLTQTFCCVSQNKLHLFSLECIVSKVVLASRSDTVLLRPYLTASHDINYIIRADKNYLFRLSSIAYPLKLCKCSEE